MNKKNNITLPVSFVLIAILFIGCSQKTFNESMNEKARTNIDSKVYSTIQDSYAQSLITPSNPEKNYVSIFEDKSLTSVLKELELIDGNHYYLKTPDVLVPKNRIKIESIDQLNKYLSVVIDKSIVVSKVESLSLVELVDKSENKKVLFSSIPFVIDGDISIHELMKLITSSSGFEISTDKYVSELKDFQNNIIYIKADNIMNALNTISNSRDLYLDIDYNNKRINLSKYKDVVIELNIPMLNLKTSNKSSSITPQGSNQVENQSSVFSYDELNKILTSIIKNDLTSTFHIDQSSGLIYLKSTKSTEQAVRNIAKAYEESFSKEAVIEFERLEIILNKEQQYGIASIVASGKDSSGQINTGTINTESTNISIDNGLSLNKITSLTAIANNRIGYLLNYSKNLIVLKNNIPTIQSLSENKDYISKIDKTVSENNSVSTSVTVDTIKDGTAITAVAKINRDKIFLNITPSIKKFIKFTSYKFDNQDLLLPEYKDQSYNISKEINLNETVIVGSIIINDDAKDYVGVLPLDGFAIGGTDSKSYVRREIVYVVTLKSLKGF